MRLVPTNKLLVVVGLVILPLSILVAFVPDKAALAVVLTGLLVAVALYDAVLAPGQLAGVGVTLPEILRLSKFRDGNVEVNIENKNML